MIIKNFKSLSNNTRKKYALSIIEAGLQAAMPRHTLEKIVYREHLLIKGKKIDLTRYHRIFVVAMTHRVFFHLCVALELEFATNLR